MTLTTRRRVTGRPRCVAMPISSFLPNLGGMEVGLHNIASHLVTRGYKPVVMAPAPHVAQLYRDGWDLPYEVHAFPPKIWSILRRAPKVGLWVLDRYFSWMQRRYAFDVWHGTMGYPVGVAIAHFAQKGMKVPHLIRCAGEDIQRMPDIGYGARLDPSVDALVRRWLPSAQRLIAISESVADEYRSLGVTEPKIVHISNGVDVARFENGVDVAAIRKEMGLNPDAFLFLSVGRNHAKKNYAMLIEAAHRLVDETDIAFEVAIVGRGVEELGGLLSESSPVRLLQEIGGGASEVNPPSLPSKELVSLYKAADGFVFPSKLETFGVAIVEAMAAALPVIVGDAPGCRDVIRGGQDGLLVDPNDPDAITSAMKVLLNDAEMKKTLSMRSTARAKDFDWPHVVDLYCELYEELIAESLLE